MKRNLRHLIFLPCLLLLLSVVTRAQPSLESSVLIDPSECGNDGFRYVVMKFKLINSTPADSNYHFGYKFNPNTDTFTIWGAPIVGDSLTIGYYLTDPIDTVFMYLTSPNPPYIADSDIVVLETLCENAIYGSFLLNNTGSCDSGYNIMAPVSLRIDRNGVPVDTVSGIGVYGHIINPAYTDSIYAVTPINLSPYYSLSCPATGSYSFSLDTFGPLHMNFGFDCNPAGGFDLYGYASGNYRTSVFPSVLNLIVGNNACNGQTTTATLTLDPAYTFVSSGITPTSVSGQTISWTFNDLSLIGTQQFTVSIQGTSAAIGGNLACSELTITPTSGDNITANNTFTLCDTIRSSMDPNDKKVSPAGDIAPGTLLTYTINFENLGNDTALNVSILDTLSAHLNLSTLELVTSSHPVELIRRAYNNTEIVRFSFPNIRLADKDHPQSNKGFVIYKVKAKANLAPGTVISNTGHIYFDNNPDVVTNTVSNKIPVPSSIKEKAEEDGLKIYPNPAGKTLFVRNDNNRYHHVKIVNILGQVMMESPLHKGINHFDTGTLPTGIYYLVVTGAKGSKSVKLSRL